MPTPTYTALATVTLASSAASVTFSSIPATYRDLILVFRGTLTTTAVVGARANGDTGSNYTLVRMVGPVVSSSHTETYFPLLYSGSPLNGLSIVQFMDYSATDKHKTALTRSGDFSADRVEAIASRWANTAAINSLTVSSTFASGCTFNLYGVIA